MWKTFVSSDKEKFGYKTKVGVIANYSSEQFLKRDFEVYTLIPINHEKHIKRYNIDIVFVDSELYETNHPWKDFTTDNIVDQLQKLNTSIYIINNSEKDMYDIKGTTTLQVNNRLNKVEIENNSINIPILLNEKLFNPTEKMIQNDILFLSFSDKKQPNHYLEFYTNSGFKIKQVSYNNITKVKTQKLIDEIKKSKVLHIDYTDNLNKNFRNFIEKVAISLGTLVILDPEFEDNSLQSQTFEDFNLLRNYLHMVFKHDILFDKHIISKFRDIMINNTTIMYNSYDNILRGNSEKSLFEITVLLISTNEARLKKILANLNRQINVKLQIIVVTENYNIGLERIENYEELSIHEISFFSKNKEKSLGKLLNKNIGLLKYNHVCKISDKLNLFPNFLQDQYMTKSYSNATIVGRSSRFIYLENEEITLQMNNDEKECYSDIIIEEIFYCELKVLNNYLFSEETDNIEKSLYRKVKKNNGKLYSSKPYELLFIENNIQNIDDRLVEKSNFYCFGNAHETLYIK